MMSCEVASIPWDILTDQLLVTLKYYLLISSKFSISIIITITIILVIVSSVIIIAIIIVVVC